MIPQEVDQTHIEYGFPVVCVVISFEPETIAEIRVFLESKTRNDRNRLSINAIVQRLQTICQTLDRR